MKILNLIAIVALSLGLTSMAHADHDGTDGKSCARKHGMQEADANKDGVISHDEFTAAHQKKSEEMWT